jgi:hypothetical protein
MVVTDMHRSEIEQAKLLESIASVWNEAIKRLSSQENPNESGTWDLVQTIDSTLTKVIDSHVREGLLLEYARMGQDFYAASDSVTKSLKKKFMGKDKVLEWLLASAQHAADAPRLLPETIALSNA